MFKQLIAIALLCLIANFSATSAASCALPLNTVLSGQIATDLVPAVFDFVWDTVGAVENLVGNQLIVVTAEVGSLVNPILSVTGPGILGSAQAQCSSSNGQANSTVKCSWSFPGCVSTSSPQHYRFTVSPAASGSCSFSIASVSVSALLTAAVSTVTDLNVCCGVTGAVWHLVEAAATDVITAINVVVTEGSLTTGNLLSGNLAIPPGILVIPAGSTCPHFSLLSVVQNILSGLESTLCFVEDIIAGASVTLNLDASLQIPGASYWVMVVSSVESCAQYNINAIFDSTLGGTRSARGGMHNPTRLRNY